MQKIISKLQRNKFIQKLASLNITILCLFLLFVLTFWGTVAQVENGLYASQARFFSSFYFLAMGFLPFPGAQLVLWVLGVNLVCALFSKRFYTPPKYGLIIVHYGLILFLVAAFVTLHNAQESHLTLYEGQAANVSESYHDWEIAFIQNKGGANQVSSFDISNLKEGERLTFGNNTYIVKTFYKNAQAFAAPFAGVKEKYLNSSGINILEPAEPHKEPEKNIPGLILVSDNAQKDLILLFGADRQPVKISTQNNEDISLSLRHTRFPLPITVRLIDFMMEKHPGTEVARSYKSKVSVEQKDSSRETIISMNEPLRYKDFTFYQASYQIDQMGNEISTLAVVKNAGRVLPYWATFIVSFGLALHFLLAAFKAVQSRKNS